MKDRKYRRNLLLFLCLCILCGGCYVAEGSPETPSEVPTGVPTEAPTEAPLAPESSNIPSDEIPGVEEEPVPTPEAEAKADYSYTLTTEQELNYQSAVCYLLRREGEDIYRVQYSNCGVTLVDGKLNTNYNGMAIEIYSPEIESFYPVLDLCGDREEGGNYIGTVSCSPFGDYPDYTLWRFLLNVNTVTNSPEVIAARENNKGTDEQLFTGEFSDRTERPESGDVLFPAGTFYHITYDENGNLLPLNEWEKNSSFAGYMFTLNDDVKMNYVPLTGGEYYILYEITDVQGNVSCSELIPYKTKKAIREIKTEPDVTAKWAKGERQQFLFECNGVEFYLSVEKDTSGNSFYALKVKNNTDIVISCMAQDLRTNGNIACGDYLYLTVRPGKFVADEYGFSFGVADGSPEMEEITSLQFSVYAKDDTTGQFVVDKQIVLVDMTAAWPIDRKYTDYFDMNEPAMDAMAGEQILLENGSVRLTLVGAGTLDSSWSNDLTLTFRLENLSSQEQYVNIDGVEINGEFFSVNTGRTIPEGCISYLARTISEYSVENVVGNSIESLVLLVEIEGQEEWRFSSKQQHRIPVNLTLPGTTSLPE